MRIDARITFDKPDARLLATQGHTVVDMHLHTPYSDGFATIGKIAARSRVNGIGVGVTDHNAIGGVRPMQQQGILVLPGIEITMKEGLHLLAYFSRMSELESFYEKNIQGHTGKALSDPVNVDSMVLLDQLANYNALVSPAHPYGPSFTGVCKHLTEDELDRKILERVGAVEVINGGAMKGMNKKAVSLAHRLGKAITGGSDAHMIFEVGGVVSHVPYPTSVEGFLEAIRKHENYVVGMHFPMHKKVVTNARKMPFMAKNPVGKIKRNVAFYRSVRKSARIAEAEHL